MIVFGHSGRLIFLGVIISGAPAGGSAVLASFFDLLPPHFQSLFVLPQMLRGTILVRQVLVPAQDRESVLDGHLEVPSNVRYALTSSGIERSEVTGSLGSSDKSEPDATPSKFFASAASEMNGRRASLTVSRKVWCC